MSLTQRSPSKKTLPHATATALPHLLSATSLNSPRGGEGGGTSPLHHEQSQHDLVKHRMLQLRQEEKTKQQQALLAKEERAHQRELAELSAERAAQWRSIVCAVLSAQAWPVENVKAIRLGKICAAYFPLVLVKARRWIRQCRARLALPHVAKPTVQELRTDQMLGLFPESRVQHLIDTATLRYYFPDESIVFKGSRDEEECYCLATGTAEIPTQGIAFQPGAVLGSVGMISGEPRTATVVVRGEQGALVWVLHRSDFEAFEQQQQQQQQQQHDAKDGSESATTTQAAIARTIVNDLREQNLKRVYGPMLEAAYWVHAPVVRRGRRELR